MPVLYFYLYNIFALYVVFVRLIHRAAPSHRIASIVRSAASIHGFLCLSFKFAISRRAVISPNRFNRSIFGILCLSFKFAISRCAAPSHRIASIVRSATMHVFFMSLFQIRDIASPPRTESLQSFDLQQCTFFYVSLSNSRYRVALPTRTESLQSFVLRCLCTAFYVVCGNAIG